MFWCKIGFANFAPLTPNHYILFQNPNIQTTIQGFFFVFIKKMIKWIYKIYEIH